MALSELLKKKYTQHFHMRDIDGDGFVERRDYERYAEQIAELRGWKPGTAEHERMREIHLGVWTFFWQPEDTDGDDRISLVEHLAAMEQLVSNITEETLEASKRHSYTIFDVLDADNDGVISVSEYRQFFEATGHDTSWVEDAFARLDRTGQGQISREELTRLHLEFFTSEDPDAPGNLFYGPLD